MTNNDPGFLKDLMKSSGADAIIKKPFRFSQLMEQIGV
jgi:hypothetical protein